MDSERVSHVHTPSAYQYATHTLHNRLAREVEGDEEDDDQALYTYTILCNSLLIH
jgi:hypothetical protein